MTYDFWSDYKFIPYELVLKFDVRLYNVIKKLENFFRDAKKDSYEDEKIIFHIAGSCIKADTFRDIDVFLPTKEILDKVCDNLKREYFLYENNANTYKFEDDVIQIVYRERFLNQDIKFMVDIFDFYSTKIAFKCELDTKDFSIKVLKSEIREEFIKYLLTKRNSLTRININPFVSLQRAINFLKRGDDIPFSVFLNICSKICEIDKNDNVEKYLERLQGDDDKLDEIKDAIREFMKINCK